MYSFEFDPKKSKSNLEKHGIDFVTAQDLWRDVRFVELDAKSTEE
ncbi:BrnT family toxin, partial [Oleiphilus sp. HI0066]